MLIATRPRPTSQLGDTAQSPRPGSSAGPLPARGTNGGTTSATPTQTYVIAYSDSSFTVPAASGDCDKSSVDFDQPGPDVQVGSFALDIAGADLEYGFCFVNGLTKKDARYFGLSTGSKPDPASCAQHARSSAAGLVDPKKLTEGAAFCLTTDHQNILWIKLVQEVESRETNYPDLVFQATMWRQTES